jgi:acetylornithine deacetylase/succinyl-diaminopimelate desuccinylase-like protein
MCFEGMEESGSEGLDDLIMQEAKGFFKTADCVCISDNCKLAVWFYSRLARNHQTLFDLRTSRHFLLQMYVDGINFYDYSDD